MPGEVPLAYQSVIPHYGYEQDELPAYGRCPWEGCEFLLRIDRLDLVQEHFVALHAEGDVLAA